MALDKVEEIGINWNRIAERISEDPYEFIEMGPQDMRKLILENLKPLAHFVGAKAIVYECGKWYARIERVDLEDDRPEVSEVIDKECYVSLEDENGCEVVVLAIREDETGELEGFARTAGEILEIFLKGQVCDAQDLDFDDMW